MSQHNDDKAKLALIGVCRFRFGTDGTGITTLIGFHGCPLSCRYCLNPQSISPTAELLYISPMDLYKELAKDELYFLGTGGGVTFGGGEPLIHIDDIQRLIALGADRWKITIETSLNVPLDNLIKVSLIADEFIVDVKDLDPQIYNKYTGTNLDNVVRNLKWLAENGHHDKVLIRLPLIPCFNTEEDREISEIALRQMGFHKFNKFTYIVR